MSKVVVGAYGTVEETIRAVHSVIQEGNRSPSDVVIVTNNDNRQKIMNRSPVVVDGIDTDSHRSVWESFKSMFASKYDEAPLEEYGVDVTTAREYNDAIRFGKFLVLVEENTGGNFGNTYQSAEGRDVRDTPRDLFNESNPKRPLDRDNIHEPGEGLDLTNANENTHHGRVPPE